MPASRLLEIHSLALGDVNQLVVCFGHAMWKRLGASPVARSHEKPWPVFCVVKSSYKCYLASYMFFFWGVTGPMDECLKCWKIQTSAPI